MTNGDHTRRMTSSTQPMMSYKRNKDKPYSVHAKMIYTIEINELNKIKEHLWGVPTFFSNISYFLITAIKDNQQVVCRKDFDSTF